VEPILDLRDGRLGLTNGPEVRLRLPARGASGPPRLDHAQTEVFEHLPCFNVAPSERNRVQDVVASSHSTKTDDDLATVPIESLPRVMRELSGVPFVPKQSVAARL
jgi:hypothetical protein